MDSRSSLSEDYSEDYLPAAWTNKPDNVRAVTTLRSGGFSQGGHAAYNLATHVGDDLPAVIKNRAKLTDDLQLPSAPVWLDQIHSNKVFDANDPSLNVSIPQADASISRQKGVVCAVLTADCLPVFFCNQSGTEVAVAHAGWRGLHAGIIGNTIAAMKSPASEILISLGPAIGPQSFEVGRDVFTAFVEKNEINEKAFTVTTTSRYVCDIYQLARIELQALGVEKIAGGDFCTYRENERFYSFRRESVTGRMAHLIWFL